MTPPSAAAVSAEWLVTHFAGATSSDIVDAVETPPKARITSGHAPLGFDSRICASILARSLPQNQHSWHGCGCTGIVCAQAFTDGTGRLDEVPQGGLRLAELPFREPTIRHHPQVLGVDLTQDEQ